MSGLVLAFALGEDAVVQSSGRHNPQLGGAVEIEARFAAPWSLSAEVGVTGTHLQASAFETSAWRFRPALLLNATGGQDGWRAIFSAGPAASVGASTWPGESEGTAWIASPAGRFRARLARRIGKGTWVDGGMGVTGRIGGLDADLSLGLRWTPGR